MRRKKLIVILFLFLGLGLSAQDMLGLRSSTYSGVYGISQNPATMAVNRLYMDFNLLGMQGFAETNYFYIRSGEFYSFLTDRVLPIYYTHEREKRNYAIDRSDEVKSGYQNLSILGPSAMVVMGRHAFGLTTAFRSVSSMRNLSPDLAVFLYEGVDYDVQQMINYTHYDETMRGSSMAWIELGLSYAYTFRRYKWDSWTAGITVKPMFARAGLYMAATDADYMVHNDDSASVYNATLEFGLALPLEYDSDQVTDPFKTRGTGVGFDLGVIYEYTEKGHSTAVYSRLCEPPYDEYNYRIGFSVLDIGYIRYKENAFQQTYVNSATEWYRPYDTIKYNSVSNFLLKMENHFLEEAEQFEENEEFTMYLPPAISLQGDLKLKRYVYLNFTGIYGLKLGNRFLYRPSILAFSARYETARWEISLPLSVYEWQFSKPRVGLYVRYGNFFIGSDRLNPLIGVSNFNGMDFYFGLRLNLSNVLGMNYIKGNCGMRRMYNIETFDYRNF